MKLSNKTHKTERTGVAVVMHWMREIIEKNNLDLGLPDVETGGADRKMPDLVIYESRRSSQVLCLIEAKPPYFDVFDETELKEPARSKATQRGAKYFALLNFKKLIWFSTERANKMLPEEEQIVDKYALSEINNLDDIEQTRFKEQIKRRLGEFLLKLYAVHAGKEAEPRIAIDDFLVLRLQEKISLLAHYYRYIIEEQANKNQSFAHKLAKWFADQNWNFTRLPEDFDKAARQTAYLLVNKILFYDLVQAKRPNDLDPLEIPVSLTKGAMLQNTLQGYFRQVLKIDYETIFSADFVDELAFPDAREVVEEIKKLISILNRYDFSTLGFDIIGRIFERLIPRDERHNLGQYFTSADVVDLILKFCLKHESDITLDPSCGAGTFLVRAYQHKKLMNGRLAHVEILDKLWGNDIAKFPASLAIINLAINDLAVDENYPNVIQEDFFKFQVGGKGLDLEEWRTRLTQTLRGKEREIIYPRYFDAIVGNPPYTRQEEISEISPDDAAYKEKLIENALMFNGKKFADIGKRAGIHAYFFVHGTKFLKNGGRFGFIVSNSWLDTDYGRGLQEFFLTNHKIVAIIESKVERWFEQADVNTCIIILEKCDDEKMRAQNLVRFVYLKKPLRHFIPATSDIWEEQVARQHALDGLRKTILLHTDIYENDELRIYPRSQAELWTEGFDAEEQKYVGAKWGKYLRAPEIFFKILVKAKDKLVPLRQVAKVRFGIKTGANEFFYLTEAEIKRRGIEKQFWMHKNEDGKWIANKVIVSPRESQNVVPEPDKLKRIILLVDGSRKLNGKKVLDYIQRGESIGFNQRKTCATRKVWYALEKRETSPILFPMIHHDRQAVFANKHGVAVDHNLFEIRPKRKYDTLPLLCFLLSTVGMLFKELVGRSNLGEGALKTEGVDIYLITVAKTIPKEARRRLRNLAKKYPNPEIKSIFQDLQANSAAEVSLDKIRQDRRELDKIIMGDILGLTEAEQLEVYAAVVDLVKSRLDKAKSFGKRSNKNGDVLGDALSQDVFENFVNGG